MFSVNYEAGSGIIHCSSGGFKSVAEVEEHSRAIDDAMQQSYRAFGRVMMLVVVDDNAMVQTADVMEATKAELERFRPQDRIACVVSRQLLKLQAARTLVSDRYKIFMSEPDALAWLTAERPIRQGTERDTASVEV